MTKPSAPAVQREWSKFVDPIERRDAIRAVSAALEWPNETVSAIKRATEAIRAISSAPERQSKSSMQTQFEQACVDATLKEER